MRRYVAMVAAVVMATMMMMAPVAVAVEGLRVGGYGDRKHSDNRQNDTDKRVATPHSRGYRLVLAIPGTPPG